MLTSLIGNEDKTIERKHRLERYTLINPVLPEYAGNVENSGSFVTPQLQIFYEQLLWSQSCISHLQYRALLLHRCLCQMSHPGSVIHHRLYLVGGIMEQEASWEAAQPLGDAPCLAAPAFRKSKLLSLIIGIWLSPLTRPVCFTSCIAKRLSRGGTKKNITKQKEKHPCQLRIEKDSLVCPALPHFISTPAPQPNSQKEKESQITGHRVGSGVWGLSKAADQTGSLIKHPPTAAAEVCDCPGKACPPTPISTKWPWGSSSSSQATSHWSIHKHKKRLSAVQCSRTPKSMAPSSSKAPLLRNANTPISAISTRERIHCNCLYFCGVVSSFSDFSQGQGQCK